MNKALFIFMAALAMTSCKRKPVSGVVVEKKFKPPQPIVTVVSTGKTCFPRTTITPALWLIYIEDSTGERHPRSISHREYDKIRIWQRIVNDSIVWQ